MCLQWVTAKAEKWAGGLLMTCGPVIKPLARLFLLCTFIEDAFRMAFQWDVQVRKGIPNMQSRTCPDNAIAVALPFITAERAE